MDAQQAKATAPRAPHVAAVVRSAESSSNTRTLKIDKSSADLAIREALAKAAGHQPSR